MAIKYLLDIIEKLEKTKMMLLQNHEKIILKELKELVENEEDLNMRSMKYLDILYKTDQDVRAVIGEQDD